MQAFTKKMQQIVQGNIMLGLVVASKLMCRCNVHMHNYICLPQVICVPLQSCGIHIKWVNLKVQVSQCTELLD